MASADFQKRILVVDDEPVIILTMTAILERQNFAVRGAADGFAALLALRQTLPDLIISDLRMPNMSGFEFLSIVRRRFPHIPIIAVSGEFVTTEMPAGLLADAFLPKGGYTPQQLFDTVARLIAESPIRPHLAKADKAPLWIPRSTAEYVIATCPECLRSFPIDDHSVGSDVRTSECPSCGNVVRYVVDSATLKMHRQKQPSLK